MLAARLGQAFVDNDTALEARTGRSAREIVAADGADALHTLEAETLVDALDRPEPAVIAAAAAAAVEPDVVAALATTSWCICGRRRRCWRRGSSTRPTTTVTGRSSPTTRAAVLAEQFAARDGRYRELATLVVDADRDAGRGRRRHHDGGRSGAWTMSVWNAARTVEAKAS